MIFLSETMRSGLSKSESNVFQNILVMHEPEIMKRYLKNVCINSLGTEISQNHLSILTVSDHLFNIEIEKYGPSAFKCRITRIFPSPGCEDQSYRMKKFLTYIWKYFLRTGRYRFYTLLVPKVTSFVA